ncbi:hypothetical protein [Hymenobacter sediminicola]|uniref:Uncharacterized protein n=1 Tax=Hymenobacter sediminicola TaxID=2761579 RepID=A0A7G7W6Z8_9BACT|nr:hypothetical protein [Hymenobacter sediminicola]QNH62141.1 hypothetical protein H4317_18660 [Hymenobacter sediminicola]
MRQVGWGSLEVAIRMRQPACGSLESTRLMRQIVVGEVGASGGSALGEAHPVAPQRRR